MLTCDEARRLLWPLDGPRESVEGEGGARAHLEACEACRLFFHRDALIARGLRARGLAVPAPTALRARVIDALAREPAIGRRRGIGWAPWLAAAASIAAVSLAVFRGPAPSVDAAYARAFMSRAAASPVVDGPDPAAVTAFFMAEFGTDLPAVVPERSEITRALVCLVAGRRAAMVEYALSGHTLAHYRIPLEPGGAATSDRATMADEDGLCVFRWNDGRFEQALVSDMPPAELEALAQLHFAVAP
jgi:hypothetical protein